jgi:outer membrane receptor protein involved in Fe transport
MRYAQAAQQDHRVSYNAVVRLVSVSLFLLLLAVSAAAQTITGVVVDVSGAAIEKASVSLVDRTTVQTRTDSNGHFTLAGTISNRTFLIVKAEGFAQFERRLAPDGVFDFTVVLQPATLNADVTVSITRTDTRLSETPASVVALTREDLDSTAAQTVDDSLRQVAGFTLFRRGSSKTTNPTAQGANLRGVSGSGASRAAVLFDGLTLNDAFGGWTFWSRVPMIAVEQAEVLRGGASSLYGSGGLSGAVDLVPMRNKTDGAIFNAQASAGTQNTYDGSFYTAYSRNGWGFDLAAEAFKTDGYIPVAENERGLVDTQANSRHNNGIFSIERRFLSEPPTGVPAGASPSGVARSVGGQNGSSRARILLRGNIFDEHRDNGTSLTYNKTYSRQAAGGVDLSGNKVGDLQFRTFIEAQVYDQTFSSVSADRNTETLTRLQRVPSQASGASVFWTKPIKEHTLVSSFEFRDVRGFSDEVGYFGGNPTSVSGSGGRQRTIAFLLQDNWTATEKLNINLGVRFDRWKNLDAHSATRPLATNIVIDVAFPDRDETAVSPRVAAIYQVTPNASIYGSYSRSFRAPTLNELYRGFRVGSIITQPNENLKAEYANTFEGGINLSAIDRRLNIRGNLFSTNVNDPVVSVTLASTPTLITRQRQNLGETRATGLEVDAEFAVTSALRLSASYLLVSSRVTEFPGNPVLIDKFLPQIAQQQLTFQLSYRPPSRFSFGIQGRFSSGQWEDDLNTLRLRPYFTMDATAAYRIHKNLDLFAAAENIFNSRYDIGLTPVRTVAAPAFIRAGLRLNFGNR